MPRELDRWVAKHFISGALSSLNPPRGQKVACPRSALRAALLSVAREAHEIGFLEGQKEPRVDLSDLLFECTVGKQIARNLLDASGRHRIVPDAVRSRPNS